MGSTFGSRPPSSGPSRPDASIPASAAALAPAPSGAGFQQSRPTSGSSGRGIVTKQPEALPGQQRALSSVRSDNDDGSRSSSPRNHTPKEFRRISTLTDTEASGSGA